MEEALGDLFDHIDDLLDFPSDDDEVNALPPPPLAANGALAAAGDDWLECSSEQKPRDEVDIAELEWTTALLGGGSDCFLLDLQCYAATKPPAPVFCAASQVSVLETKPESSIGHADPTNSSFSSSSASYFSGVVNEVDLFGPTTPLEVALAPAIPSRVRSKRRRAAAFSPRPHAATRFFPPSSDSAAIPYPESFGDFCPAPLSPPAKKIKITFNKKSKVATTTDEEEEWDTPSPVAARKCLHCETQKTPQWRAGPMGPKTLCNACGVRYNSGRLFPEYRPATSPTFVPALHSNTHKKVVEMRIQATKMTSAPAYDGCDLLEHIRRRH